MRGFAFLMSLALLTACSGPSDQELHPEEYDEAGNWKYSKGSNYFEGEGVDEASIDDDEQAADDNEIKGGETYSQYDARRDGYAGSRGAFGEYGCTVNCGGHEAGYEWAQDKGITDPDQCGGKSWSFEEGCRAYAEENGGN